MKRVLLSVAVMFFISLNATAADLYKKTFKFDSEFEPKSRILETFKSALQDPQKNQVQQAIEKLKTDLDDLGTVRDLAEEDIYMLGSGKGSAFQYSSSFLVGIPVSMKGTGMIETRELYFLVRVSVDMSTEKEIVYIQSFASLKPQ